ncbi:hypothetical protein N3K66_000731 [Trichothecium roseum]|uniref:Uncharacterized protein n=1 Tax=Trichothecium roseum TaxID=47278 RepID=A0ACC0VCU0_9HYPO|nr:hypothetical protein N3K66_000731 [Trichothecium roseum]
MPRQNTAVTATTATSTLHRPSRLEIVPPKKESFVDVEIAREGDPPYFAAMNSPLGSPKLAAGLAKFRNRVPNQARRCIPLYLGFVLIMTLILNADVLSAVPSPFGAFTRIERVPAPPRLPGSTFPPKIWQTWKIDPLMFGIKDTVVAKSWLDKNPYLRYEVITDANEMSYVEQHFGPGGLDRPDIVGFYRSLRLPIIKADLLRYMIMYAEGGVYADIDVEAIKPLHRFFPARFDEGDYDMVIGIEIDQPAFKDHPILGKKSMSFCQWTIIAKPGQPVFIRLIENIMAWMGGVARQQGVGIGDVELDFDQVIVGTGPTAFTSAMLEEMNRRTPRGSRRINWEDDFHAMDESKIVGRVLVLDVEAFCAGQGHSDSGNHGARGALVKHHYHASGWPSRHRRYNHPAYGQVEECNWVPDCVARWDKDVAEWEGLAEEEKQHRIKVRTELVENWGKH